MDLKKSHRKVKTKVKLKSFLCWWALCMKLSHGIKSALLDGKLRTGTSKTKKSHAWLVEIALFWRLLHTFCHPAWRILYHVTVSCKESILQQPYTLLDNEEWHRISFGQAFTQYWNPMPLSLGAERWTPSQVHWKTDRCVAVLKQGHRYGQWACG